MKKTDKKIMIPKEVRNAIMRDFGCSASSVTFALTYQRNSPQARMIRKIAMEHGGRIYDGTRDVTEIGQVVYLKQGEQIS